GQECCNKGFSVGGSGNVYKNFEITGVWGQALTGCPFNTTFQNLHIHHNGHYCHTGPGGDPYCPSHGFKHGMYLCGDTDQGTNFNITIDNCNIHDQDDGTGMQLYGGGITVQNTTIRNTHSQAIYALGQNQLIRNNLIVNGGYGYGALSDPDSVGAGIFMTATGTKVLDN